MSAETSNPVFNDAANVEVKKLPELGIKLSNDDLLKLYGLYKVAVGHDITQKSAPSMFNVSEKKKWNSWKAYVDEGMTEEQAQEKYIEFVEQLKKRDTNQ